MMDLLFKIHFEVEGKPPPVTPLREALAAVRGLAVEAPTEEAGEHYTQLIIEALERAAA